MDIEESINLTDKTNIPLKRVLGLLTSILLVAGIMIGSGVFKKIAPMAASGLSQKYLIAAWVVAGVITMFGAFIIAGLSNLTVESGGQYEYLRMAFGGFMSFLFGWTSFTIIGSASVAALAFIFAQSVNGLLPLYNPFHDLSSVSIVNFIYPFASSGVKILAIITIILLTWVNYRGTKKGASLNSFLTWLKVAGILFLIALGLFFSNNTQEVAASTIINKFSNTAMYTAFFGALLSAFWAYDGWADLAYVTGEVKNPKKNIPVAIITGVGIVMIMYVLVNYAYMKTLSLPELASTGENNIAASAVAQKIIGHNGVILVSILIMFSTLGALNAVIFFYPRLYYKMAKENSFFKSTAKVHPVYRTPYVALIYVMIWSAVLVLSGTFDMLTDMIIFSGFFFYVLLAWALIRMKRNGTIKAKVIGYPFVPLFIILFATALLVNTIYIQPKQTLFGIGLMLSGVPFYYYFKRQSTFPK
ncbi:MAG: amino acid permease [Ginsengibacter sp.]